MWSKVLVRTRPRPLKAHRVGRSASRQATERSSWKAARRPRSPRPVRKMKTRQHRWPQGKRSSSSRKRRLWKMELRTTRTQQKPVERRRESRPPHNQQKYSLQKGVLRVVFVDCKYVWVIYSGVLNVTCVHFGEFLLDIGRAIPLGTKKFSFKSTFAISFLPS